MRSTLQDILESLESDRSTLVRELRGMDGAQLNFRPSPEAWSALEVAEHLLLAEQVSVGTMLRLDGRPSRRRSVIQRLGRAGVWLVLKLGIRVPSPARVTLPNGGMSLTELVAEWDVIRHQLLEFLEGRDEAALEQAGFNHPICGPLNLWEGLLFLKRHLRHHMKQVERLRRHAGFPNAGHATALRAEAR